MARTKHSPVTVAVAVVLSTSVLVSVIVVVPKLVVAVEVAVTVAKVFDVICVAKCVLVAAYGKMWRNSEQKSCASLSSKISIISPGS